MGTFRAFFVAGAAGVGLAVLTVVLATGVLQGNTTSAAPSGPPVPHYVTFVSPEAQVLLEGDRISESLILTPANSADDVWGRVFGTNADGVVVDDTTLEQLPDGALANLYASGRVVVVFDVEKADVLRAARSSEAYADADLRFIPEVTLSPGLATGRFESPYFSVVYRSRPGTGNVAGGETTVEFDEPLFVALLVERAQYARGIFELPPGSIEPGSIEPGSIEEVN